MGVAVDYSYLPNDSSVSLRVSCRCTSASFYEVCALSRGAVPHVVLCHKPYLRFYDLSANSHHSLALLVIVGLVCSVPLLRCGREDKGRISAQGRLRRRAQYSLVELRLSHFASPHRTSLMPGLRMARGIAEDTVTYRLLGFLLTHVSATGYRPPPLQRAE